MTGPSGREQRRHTEDFRKPIKIEQGGVIRLTGAFLLDHEEEIVNLIKHEAKLAAEKNPAHKLNKIEKANGGLVAELSDHNLTLHIGKKLVGSYKGEHSYKFSQGEKFVEVDWKRD